MINGGIDAINAHVAFEVAQVVEHGADVNLVVDVLNFIFAEVFQNSFGDFDDVRNRVTGYLVSEVFLPLAHVLYRELFAALEALLNQFSKSESSSSRDRLCTDVGF